MTHSNAFLQMSSGLARAPIRKHLITLGGVLGLLSATSVFSQSAELQEKLAAARQAAAENKQRLLQYQWTETTQLTLKGDQKPPTQSSCRYGPDGQMQKTPMGHQAGNVSLNPIAGAVNLVFTNYAQPGDKMTLTFDTAAKKITTLSVATYMGEAKDAVTLNIKMGSLPDGTNYPEQTVLTASAKQLTVTTTNANYQKL